MEYTLPETNILTHLKMDGLKTTFLMEHRYRYIPGTQKTLGLIGVWAYFQGRWLLKFHGIYPH